MSDRMRVSPRLQAAIDVPLLTGSISISSSYEQSVTEMLNCYGDPRPRFVMSSTTYIACQSSPRVKEQFLRENNGNNEEW